MRNTRLSWPVESRPAPELSTLGIPADARGAVHQGGDERGDGSPVRERALGAVAGA
jgi:hypothetical protein